MGEAGRADTELAEARRLSTDNRYSSITRLRAAAYWGVPKIQALYEATYFAGAPQGRSAGGMTATRPEAELKRALPSEPIPTLAVAFSVPARVGSF